jgi:hypothetical protein
VRIWQDTHARRLDAVFREDWSGTDLAHHHALDSRQCLVEVCCIGGDPEPEAEAVTAVIAVHVYFGKLCLNLACTPRLKGKEIAVFGLSAPWRNQIRKPQSLDMLKPKPLDKQRHECLRVRVDLLHNNSLSSEPIEYGGKPVKTRGIEGCAQESARIPGIPD